MPATRIGAQNEEKSLIVTLMVPFGILIALTAVPLVFTFWNSLFSWNLMYPDSRKFIWFGNFLQLATDSLFWNAAGNTLYQVTVTVAGQLLLGLLIALLLDRSFLGVGILRSLYLFPMMTTPIVAGLAWRMFFNGDFGIINYFLNLVGLPGPNWLGDPAWAMPAVILTDWWLSTPFVTMILLAGLKSMSQEPYEAARIDGATWFQTFRFVTLPQLTPMILLATLFRVMDAIKRFDSIFVMTAGGPGNATETFNLYAYNKTFVDLDIGYGAALSVLMLVVSLGIASIILKKLQQD